MMSRRTMLSKPSPMSLSNSAISLNSTTLGSSGSALQPSTSFSKEYLDQLELKLSYDAYQVANLKALIVEKEIEKKQQMAADQLSILIDKLTASQVEECELETKISILEKQKQLCTKVEDLKVCVHENNILLNAQVKQHIDTMVDLLDSASNKLYLRNYDAITDQCSFDLLEQMIVMCLGQVNKLLQSAGKVEGLNDLKNVIMMLKAKQATVEEYCKKFEDTNDLIVATMLKKVSDMLADCFSSAFHKSHAER